MFLSRSCLHWGVAWARAGLVLAAVAVLGLLAVSGGERAGPRTPAALPGMPAPFLGTAVVGSGELTGAVDAYGNVVGLWDGPAGRALIENPVERQRAGTVAADTGIVPRVRVGGGPARALWQADRVAQRYLTGTSVVRTVGWFGRARVVVTVAAVGPELALAVGVSDLGGRMGRLSSDTPSLGVAVDDEVRCRSERQPARHDLLCRVGRAGPVADGAAGRDGGGLGVARVIREATAGDRGWLGRAAPLGAGAPGWAVEMYERSLLTLRALTDARTGASAAGARDGWAYVWPRDAGAAALAFAAAGYRGEAREVARFLRARDLGAAARFYGDGSPVPGRAAQGDAAGWAAVAARAAGLAATSPSTLPWRDRADYWEGEPGDFLANAIAARADGFETRNGLVRRAGDPGSGLDSAAAWAVRPFSRPSLYPAVRGTLNALVADATPYGITPGSAWHGGADPWMAPTAWSAWAFAALAASPGSPDRAADRAQALRLLTALRRAATPAGALPERVDVHTGVPTSTTPLAWPAAFAVLTLRELWP